MSITEPDNPADDNALAYAALTLCGGPARGTAPELQEIAAWHEGTLSGERGAEVLSHVANNPESFQLWLDFTDAQNWLEQEELAQTSSNPAQNESAQLSDARPAQDARADHSRQAPSLLSKAAQMLQSLFQQPMPVYGGAFAAVMLAVLIAPLLRTGDGFSLQQQLDRSSDAYIGFNSGLPGAPPVSRNTRNLGGLFDELSINEVERLHFQSGLQQFFNKLQTHNATQVSESWQQWVAELPQNKVDCSIALDATHCTAVADDFIALGQWALMTTGACQRLTEQDPNALSSEFWDDQYSLYASLRSLPDIAQSQVFATLLPALAEQTPDALCSIVSPVMAAGR